MCQKNIKRFIYCLCVYASIIHAQTKQNTEYDWDAKMKTLGLTNV
jgi:hypothetical protein